MLGSKPHGIGGRKTLGKTLGKALGNVRKGAPYSN